MHAYRCARRRCRECVAGPECTGRSARRIAVGVALGIGLLALAACASTADKSAKPAALSAIAAPIAVHKSWEVDVGDAEGSFLRPAVADQALFAASRKGDLVRIDPVNGKEVWRVRVDGGIAAGVGSDGFVLAVVGPRGNVVAFDAAGKRLWEAQAASTVLTPPLVGHDLVLVRSTDQRLTAYEAATGRRRWMFQKQQPPLTLQVETELAFAGDSVLVGFPGGRLDAIALANGAGRWEAGVSEPKGATEVERLADVFGLPALLDNDVCAASYQGRLACFDARSGDLRWAREFAAGAGPAISATAVFGIDQAGHIYAFDRSLGGSLWQTAALAERGLSSPAVVGSLLVIGDFEGRIHFLKISDGSLVARYDATVGILTSTPLVWNGAVVLQTSRGRVLLLTPGRN